MLTLVDRLQRRSKTPALTLRQKIRQKLAPLETRDVTLRTLDLVVDELEELILEEKHRE